MNDSVRNAIKYEGQRMFFFESTVFCRIMSDFVFAGQVVKFNTSKFSGCSPFGC